MNTVVFLVYHGVSHFVTCFSLAKELAKDHHIVFAGHRYHESLVRSQGFAFYGLNSLPFGMGFEEWRNKTAKRKNVYLSTVKDRWTDRLYLERNEELKSLVTILNPSTILIDSWLATDVVVLYPILRRTSTRAALIHIMLPNEIVKGQPPLNSLALPGDVKAIQNSFREQAQRRRWKMFRQSIKFFGQSDQRQINRWIRINKIPERYISKNQGVMSITWNNIEEFSFTPKEFDFPEPRHPAWRHYIGFLPDRTRKESTDPEFIKVEHDIHRLVAEKKSALIYCAFGTAGTGEVNVIRKFLQHVVDVCIHRGYVLVIAFPDRDKLDLKKEEGVFLFKSVPQMNVLSRTNVFITHGGINSIKEAVYAGTPMLICPVNKKTDVVGNAVRVDYHQLGLLGDLETETEQSIDEKISQLLADERFKRNLEKLKKADEQYTVAAFLDLLKKIRPWS